MAYIGPEPNPGQNREVDDISSSFNGSTTAFTLQVGGSNVSPGSANSIIVSVGGVVQNPSTDYTINSSTITFSTAPASGLSFFGLVLGQGVDAVEPADGSVSTIKIADQAVTLAKLPHGTGSNDGKFLRANNGADPSFETVTGTTINNNADNRVITGSGTANTLEGESNLTFTGSILTVTNSSGASELTLVTPNNTDGGVYFNDGTNSGAVTYQHSDNSMRFRVNATEKMRILSGGGITFNGDTATANALDDYEFGTFTPTCAVEGQSNSSLSVATGLYVKVGKTVHVWFEVQFNGTPSNRSTGNAWEFGGFPFLSQNDSDSSHPGLRDYRFPLIAMDVDTSATYGTTGHFLLRLNDNSQGGRIEWQDSSLNIRNASLYLQNGTMVQFGCTYPTSM